MKILFYPLEGEAGLHAVVAVGQVGDGVQSGLVGRES